MEGRHFVHAITRIVGREFLMFDTEREYLWKLIEGQQRFTGVKVVTATILSNHAHLLLEQIDRDSMPELTAVELFEQRLPHIYDAAGIRQFRAEYDQLVSAGDPARIEAFLKKFADRMYSVPVFMKEIKQKFSQWYNKRNNRTGTLWESRYKSVLVENHRDALMRMAAYIDLNAVRAGMVDKVEDYRWCGYGRAVGGDRGARQGIGMILDNAPEVCGESFAGDWLETAKLYRLWLYHEGQAILPDYATGRRGRRGFSRKDLEAVEQLGGKMPAAEVLRYRVRYFTDGAALGTSAFIEQVFKSNRSSFGRSREKGSRRMRGAEWGELRVIRDLRQTVVSLSSTR
jgi:REP element-mobilizing transposase RayT